MRNSKKQNQRKKSKLINRSIIAKNRNRYLYLEVKEYIAGISLKGTEVKSIINNGANINQAFITFSKGEAFLINAYIAQWKNAARNNHDVRRKRKLLLNKREIIQAYSLCQEKKYTAIPTMLIRKNKKFKIKFIVGKRKNIYDKREKIKKREESRLKAKNWFEE